MLSSRGGFETVGLRAKMLMNKERASPRSYDLGTVLIKSKRFAKNPNKVEYVCRLCIWTLAM